MNLNILSAFTACLLLGAFVAQAKTQDPHCGTFRVYTGDGNVEVLASVPGEINIGDRRVGDFELIDMDGKKMGDFHFLSTVMGKDGDEYIMVGQSSYSFDNGHIHHPVTYRFRDPSTKTLSKGLNEFSYTVSTGTGDFTGASGTVSIARHDDGMQSRTLKLECPN